MASLRHAESEGPSARDGYLDAARACILDVGWRRTTLTEVARRAGVSRMTIYRAWPDMPSLLGDLMTREWRGVLGATGAPAVDGGDGTAGDIAGVADRVLRTVHGLRDNELFSRIVELDPELLLPYLLSRRGRSQDHVLGLIEAGITDGQAAGSIRSGSATALARALVLALHGFVLSAHTMVDDRVTQEALDAELRELVHRALAP